MFHLCYFIQILSNLFRNFQAAKKLFYVLMSLAFLVKNQNIKNPGPRFSQHLHILVDLTFKLNFINFLLSINLYFIVAGLKYASSRLLSSQLRAFIGQTTVCDVTNATKNCLRGSRL